MKGQFQEFMQIALEEAAQAGRSGEVPVGAVLVKDGEVIARAGNNVIQVCDPTGHAEIRVLREAAKTLNTVYLEECDLYVTLEPCTMCAQAIAFARVRRLIYGAFDPKGGGVDHGPRVYEQPTCHHRPEVISGIGEKACGDLLKSFFQKLR